MNTCEKAALRRQREIARLERQLGRPKGNTYLSALIFVLTLIYATDEIASQITTLMKTEIAADLMASFGSRSVGVLDLVGAVVLPFQILGLLYRPLADRFGRRPFLVLNTLGMSLALGVIFLSRSLPGYFLGACMIQFFIPHDMHVVYIMETAPAKSRAKLYSSIKFIANLGVLLVPVLRRLLMAAPQQWRRVFLLPALVGLVCSGIALVCSRETDAFLEARLRLLRLSDDARRAQKAAQKEEAGRCGLIPALRFAWQHRQLRWLYICAAALNLGFVLILEYQVILTYGYAQSYVAAGVFSDLESAAAAASTQAVTQALFFFTLGSALAQVVMGFLADNRGRKAAAITMAALCIGCFFGFWLGARQNLSPVLTGLLCGGCVGSYYACNDVLIMMIGESAPTRLRSSAITAQYVVVAIGVVLTYALALPLAAKLGNAALGPITAALLVPGFAAALAMLWKRCGDTRGLDLDTVTGCEWD